MIEIGSVIRRSKLQILCNLKKVKLLFLIEKTLGNKKIYSHLLYMIINKCEVNKVKKKDMKFTNTTCLTSSTMATSFWPKTCSTRLQVLKQTSVLCVRVR